MAEAGRVDGLARGKVVAAVEHHIRLCHQDVQQGGIGPCLHDFDLHLRVDGSNGALDRCHLGLAHASHVVGDLALQIGQVHHVVIDHRDMAHASRTEVQGHRGTQAAGANDQSATGENALLAFDPDFFQQDVA